EDERVKGGVERPDVLLVPEEERVAHDPELVRASLEARPVGAVADQTQGRLDAALLQALEPVQDVIDALDRRHPADPADREAVRRDAEVAPRLFPAVGAAADTLVQLDAEADDGELLRRRDAQ